MGDAGPGVYALVHDTTAVSKDISLQSAIVHTKSAGEVVVVTEVAPEFVEGRVRARIEQPPGWISLLHPKECFRWASKQRPGPVVLPAMLDGHSLGLTLSEELVVTRLADPRAAHAGWCVGDKITEVNEIPVDAKANFLEEVNRAKKANLEFQKPLVFGIERAPPPGHGSGHGTC